MGGDSRVTTGWCSEAGHRAGRGEDVRPTGRQRALDIRHAASMSLPATALVGVCPALVRYRDS